MKISLYIYHLDDGPEADFVIDLLKQAGINKKWEINRPTDETNSIFIPIECKFDTNEKWKIRLLKLKKSLELLRIFSKKTIDTIKAKDLQLAMRIETNEFFLPIHSEFVSECGRLGLDISIFNTAVK